jgi:hypothetical protein
VENLFCSYDSFPYWFQLAVKILSYLPKGDLQRRVED